MTVLQSWCNTGLPLKPLLGATNSHALHKGKIGPGACSRPESEVVTVQPNVSSMFNGMHYRFNGSAASGNYSKMPEREVDLEHRRASHLKERLLNQRGRFRLFLLLDVRQQISLMAAKGKDFSAGVDRPGNPCLRCRRSETAWQGIVMCPSVPCDLQSSPRCVSRWSLKLTNGSRYWIKSYAMAHHEQV